MLERVLSWILIFAALASMGAKFESITREEVLRALSPTTNYYELLGLEPGEMILPEEWPEIERDILIRFHPDRARGDESIPDAKRTLATKSEVNKVLEKVNRAKQVLLSPSLKRAYDRTLFRNLPALRPWQPDIFSNERKTLINEARVQKYLKFLLAKVRLLYFFEKQRQQKGGIHMDPDFQEALRRYFNIMIESRYGGDPQVKLLSLRRLIPIDPMIGFYWRSITTLPDLMVWITPDRVTQMAVHLLVLDTIDPISRRLEYLQGLMLTLALYGDLDVGDPVKKLIKKHFSPENLLSIYNDQLIKKVLKSYPIASTLYHNLVEFSFHYFLEFADYDSTSFAEFVIRSRVANSEEWARIVPDTVLESMSEMQRIVAREPQLWPEIRAFLFQSINDPSFSSYTRSGYKKLLKKLEPVYEDAAAKKQIPGEAKAKRPFLRRFFGIFRWIGNTCSSLFTGSE